MIDFNLHPDVVESCSFRALAFCRTSRSFPSRVDVGHKFMKLRIAVGVVAFGESEIRQGEVARAHRLDMDAETAEQRQSLA